MDNVSIYFIFVAVAYLFGAVPFGFLIARGHGVDIRTVGSGNIGATNVWRRLGRGWGLTTLALDVLKGLIPAAVFPRLAAAWSGTPEPDMLLGILCGAAAIAGHNWPIYLRFKGGKGVATSAGVLLGIAPVAMGAGLVVWLVLFFVTHYVSLASMTAGVVAAAAGWLIFGKTSLVLPVALTVLALIVIWRHRPNIRRLREGTESKSYMRKRERGREK